MEETNKKVYHDLQSYMEDNLASLDVQQTLWLCFISRCLAQMTDDIHDIMIEVINN